MASRDETAAAEENELLNGSGGRNNIKMQDAPFERVGSEEDMLEYEDPIINCDACKLKRQCTKPEKFLIGCVVIFLIIIIALAVALGNKKEPEATKFCTTKGCLQAASSLLGAMDRTADPCEDFHQYSCGGWLKETPIPPGYQLWDRFQELSYKNLYMLKSFIETHEMVGTAEAKVKTLYQSCMKESEVRRNTTITDIRGLVTSMDPDSNASFAAMLKSSHTLGVWTFFQLIVGPNEMAPDNNIIKIEGGFSPFPNNIFKVSSEEKRAANSTSPDVKVVPGNGSVVTGNQTKTATTTSPPSYSTVDQNTAAPATENVTNLVQEFLTETESILLTVFKLTPTEANKTAHQMLDIEIRLSKAHDINSHVHNLTQALNVMKVADLQTKCPIVDWAQYLDKVLGSDGNQITSKNDVIVLHEHALLQVCKIVDEYKSNETILSTLRMYMKLNIVRSLKPYFDLSTFRDDLSPEQELEIEGEHWRRCAFYANKAMGFAAGAIYVNGTSAETFVSQTDPRIDEIKDLVEYVKRAFKEYLLRKIWMDKVTKEKAATKIEDMIEKVSYPTYILNTTFLDTYYKQLNVSDDWFRNILHWRAFTVLKMSSSLGEKYDRKKSWINPPVTVESDYSAVRNDIIFPIAMFHLPIFSPEGPSAMNFGAMGSIIGHEITHAFDIQGRQYDGHGRLRDWWDPVTADMFNSTTTCMRDQYSNFKVGDIKVDGERTLEENIADNGGVRAAHIAYELWLNEHGDEQPLPGVDLTNKQIFYVSFAQLFCSKWKPEGIRDYLMRNSHSPGPFRIEGALSNSLSFQDIFQCSFVSKYNPDTKCQVW